MNNFLYIIDKLESSFKNSFYIKEKNLFVIKKNSHTDLLTMKVFEEDGPQLILCRILERLTPLIVKYKGYKEKWRNDRLKEELRQGLNKFLDKDFSYEEIEIMNEKIGETINRSLTKKFIYNNYNINILK